MRIKQLRQKKADLLADADTLADKEAAGTLTPEEKVRLDAITATDGPLDQANAAITREERLMDERRSMAAVTDINADTVMERGDRQPANVKREPEKFATFGEFLRSVAHAGKPGVTPEHWDRRLQGLYVPGGLEPTGRQAAATGLNESVPSEGGFTVQQDHGALIYDGMFEQGVVLSRVRRVPISANANGLTIPTVDETSRVNGSRWGGVLAYWRDEADTVTATKPKFREMELKLKGLMGLCYATDELLADSAALGSIISRAFTEELTFKAEDAIINGSGSGQPLGLLNSGAVVEVAKETSQAAATIVAKNIAKMWARCPARSRRTAVWLCNQDIDPQLLLMFAPVTNVAGTENVGGIGLAQSGISYAPSGANGNQLATLMGRPVLPVEYCATLGTVGDIILVDLDQYVMIDKGGIQSAQSMHVRFVNAEQTFRLTYRVDGQPAQRSAITPYKGANTLSPYVTLATRA